MPSPLVARPHEFSEFVEGPAIEGGRLRRSDEGGPLLSFSVLVSAPGIEPGRQDPEEEKNSELPDPLRSYLGG